MQSLGYCRHMLPKDRLKPNSSRCASSFHLCSALAQILELLGKYNKMTEWPLNVPLPVRKKKKQETSMFEISHHSAGIGALLELLKASLGVEQNFC